MTPSYKRKFILLYSFNIVVPLLLGLMIYLFYRRDSYLFDIARKVLYLPADVPAYLPAWLELFTRNFVADILWAYSLAFAVSAAIREWTSHKWVVFAICIGFVVFVEWLQYIKVFHGTFDIIDILLEAGAVALAILIITKSERKNHDEKNT